MPPVATTDAKTAEPAAGAGAAAAAYAPEVPMTKYEREQDALSTFNPQAGMVRLMGDPVLRQVSVEVDPTSPEVGAIRATLEASLDAFRKKHGFGRGISAVQVGFPVRMIALNLDGKHAFTMHNPVITWKSDEMFTLFDDCMSFPDIMVRLSRHMSITIEYLDELGQKQVMERVSQSVSELLQHEMDHLNGILAVDLAKAPTDIVYRAVFEANMEHFSKLVDYKIIPTI